MNISTSAHFTLHYIRYICLESYSRIVKNEILCFKYFFHLLYNHELGYENRLGSVVFERSRTGPVLVHGSKLLYDLFRTIHFNEIMDIQSSFTYVINCVDFL